MTPRSLTQCSAENRVSEPGGWEFFKLFLLLFYFIFQIERLLATATTKTVRLLRVDRYVTGIQNLFFVHKLPENLAGSSFTRFPVVHLLIFLPFAFTVITSAAASKLSSEMPARKLLRRKFSTISVYPLPTQSNLFTVLCIVKCKVFYVS